MWYKSKVAKTKLPFILIQVISSSALLSREALIHKEKLLIFIACGEFPFPYTLNRNCVHVSPTAEQGTVDSRTVFLCTSTRQVPCCSAATAQTCTQPWEHTGHSTAQRRGAETKLKQTKLFQK